MKKDTETQINKVLLSVQITESELEQWVNEKVQECYNSK